MATTDNSSSDDKIDFSKLGFAISIPSQQQQQQQQADIVNQPASQESDGSTTNELRRRQDDANTAVGYTIEALDDVSDIDDAVDDDDDDSSYGSEYSEDEHDGPAASPTKARQLNNRGFRSTGIYSRKLIPNATTINNNLGYGEDCTNNACPFSHDQLGYGKEEKPTHLHSQNNNHDHRRSSVQLVSIKGQVPRNRRSTDMGRRLSNIGKMSTHSGTTRSSMSSNKDGRHPARRTHSKSRSTHRERMVTRSSSKRLSRKHPSQVEVIRRKCSIGNCSCQTFNNDDDDEEVAMKQTLQDLGCSELILDPTRQRMPRRVSLEYGSSGSVFSSNKPKSVSLEFGCDDSTVAGRSRSRMPKRVSMEYVQRKHISPKRVLTRRGSLDFSVGTSTLPRRGSLGKDNANQQQHQHEQRRKSIGRQELARQDYMKSATTKPRRASMGGAFLRRSSLCSISSAASSAARWGEKPDTGVLRHSSDNTLTTLASGRRSSIAHIPRKKLGHRLSIKHVNSVEYLTRETLVGRVA